MNAFRASYVLLISGCVLLYGEKPLDLSIRNFHASDVLFVASAALLLFSPRGRRNLSLVWTIARWRTAALAFLAAAAVGSLGAPEPATALSGVLQLAFCLVLLAPIVAVHSMNVRRLVSLWWVQAVMIALAGALSVFMRVSGGSDEATTPRLENPLLGVNGFWLFGLVSAWVLHFVATQVAAKRWRRAAAGFIIWTFGVSGVVLSGSRVALVLTLLSLVWLPLSLRKRAHRMRIRLVFGCAGVALLAMGVVGTMERAFGTFEQRWAQEQAQEILGGTLAARVDIIRVAWADLPDRLLMGAGLGQFLRVRPEAVDTIHNVYLQVLYELGIPGLMTMVALLWAVASNSVRVVRSWASNGDRLATTYGSAPVFAVFGTAVAWMAYPLPYTRIEWLYLFLAAGPPRSAQKL